MALKLGQKINSIMPSSFLIEIYKQVRKIIRTQIQKEKYGMYSLLSGAYLLNLWQEGCNPYNSRGYV